MTALRYSNLLSLSHDGKGIPYGGFGELRADGEANYGFFNLKSNVGEIASVPELKRDPSLLSIALVLNAPDSGFFSLGSTSSEVCDTGGHRWSGYIEFAINSRARVAYAASYFPLFFHFDRFLANVQSELQ